MFSKSLATRLFWFLIFFLAIFTRFTKLNWGNNFYFQPDENNMATAISQFSQSSLNPHFFAYGQFPLYLGYFILRVFHLPNDFANSIIILRVVSAIYSLFFIYIFIKIAGLIFPGQKLAPFALLLIFSPGLIQIAHYGTTETLLCLVFAVNIFYSLKILKKPKFLYFVYIGISTSIGVASKISSLIFFLPLIICCLLIFIKSRQKLLLFFGSLFSLVICLVFGILLSPYNLIELTDFLSSMRYETSVAIGAAKVFYTSQFLHTPSYLFQLIKIFPYTSGFLVYVVGILGLFMLILKFRGLGQYQKKSWLIIIGSALVYFGYFGQLYVKWTRFMSPIFYFFPLLAFYLYTKLTAKSHKLILLLCLLLPNIFFIRLYLSPDIRVVASDWIDRNVPENSKILSEAGNVINLPIGKKAFDVYNFDFYNLDSNSTLLPQLVNQLYHSEYLLIPSRRIFYNQHGVQFPYSTRYYQALSSGNLGFTLSKSFSIQTEPFLNSEKAEETWSVFDQPTIRLYQKTTPHTVEEYTKMLIPDNQNS